MAKTARQTAIFGVEDWKRFYQTFREADFQSYDFETLRKSFVDYLRIYYPETFNDFVESSEFIALLDIIAFMGQSLAFRNDLNTRENFLDTAERRDSVVRLANLVSYTPKRNEAAQGFLKVFSVRTTEDIVDFNGISLSNVTINWNDPANQNWLEQFTYVINAALVNSQRFGRPGNSQDILGVKTDEYTINLVSGFLPIIPYNATVDGTSMPFEAVNATSQGRGFIYEPAPRPNGQFNVLYRNDQLGFGSEDTGFFFYFKQGVLQNQDFNLSEAVPNRTVDINIEGINNSDTWLYRLENNGLTLTEWRFTESIYAAAVEQLPADQRKIYSISNRNNDQVTLTFGDGVFSEIPVGLFRTYVRASNGLRYVINPEEMQSVPISISYVSRAGRTETVTFTCGITTPVSNAQPRENIAEIKQRAPARYYTQNRMVNGEDYNNFPFTKFNNIIKSKALARSSIGTSRYIELNDITTKYSSTNIFGSDGMLHKESVEPSFDFTWANRNDIVDVITNQVEPLLSARRITQFYHENFTRPNLIPLGLAWQQSTTLVNETTGYFYQVNSGAPRPIGSFASNNAQYIAQGALIKFVPPAGNYFDANNRIRPGSPSRNDEKLEIWVTISRVTLDGTNFGLGNLSDGTGPVTVNNFVPTGAIPQQVIPMFVSDLPSALEQQILQQVELYRDFGIGFDNLTGSWYLINSNNLAANSEFSLANAGNTQGVNTDASWIIKFITDGESYTATTRGIDYLFSSVIETRFFFDRNQRVYDSKTGLVISDFIKVLRSNSQPDSNSPLFGSIDLQIIDQPVQNDGYVNDFQVVVSFADRDIDGVADDPDFFKKIVAPSVNPNTKFVFFQSSVDFDNIETFLPVDDDVINFLYATKADIELVKTQFVQGQIFYAYGEDQFYELTVDLSNQSTVRNLVARTDFEAKTGRQQLSFQYRHNSNLTNVIDPGVTNIVDLYLVTQQYYTAYQNYIKDITGAITEPSQPSINQLDIAYSELNDFKMISDNIILNSVKFKPLFGSKAAPELQATIKVVQVPNSTISISEIKSQVIANINNYFTIDKWDFGDSFFFSELAAHLHERMGSLISSVVLVPTNPLSSFGDLYEIRSAPDEIFVSAATVNNIEVVAALNQSTLRSQATVSGLQPGSATGITSTTSNTSSLPSSDSGTGSSSSGFISGGSY